MTLFQRFLDKMIHGEVVVMERQEGVGNVKGTS